MSSYDSDAVARDERGEPGWRNNHRDLFAAAMRSEEKTRLLEVGAGSGHSAAFFVAEAFTVVATDLSPGNVARCRAKGLDARVGDFYDLDFPDGSFDAIWAMSCLMHVPDADLPDVLDEMARVLVPGGIAMVGLWGGRGTPGVWEGDDHMPPRFYALRTDDQVRAAFISAFVIERFESIPNPPDDQSDTHYQLLSVRKR
ncbi:MAG: class I SAM-dependent methyltransferase [Actinomycetia bacterium]|nr:class I SAM-dependent methyltransferase [Actinomycetes bacterium]